MQLRHPMAKNINRVLFEQEIPKQIENFLEGRMAYVFELEDEYAESDIPTTLMRSKGLDKNHINLAVKNKSKWYKSLETETSISYIKTLS